MDHTRAQRVAARMTERERIILDYHVRDDGGLLCPLCGSWSALDCTGTQGVRMVCDCGTITVMARAPLARAITRRSKHAHP